MAARSGTSLAYGSLPICSSDFRRSSNTVPISSPRSPMVSDSGQHPFCSPSAAMERAMKVQEVILRAMAKKITWWQAAEIIGISDRHMRRWRERYEELGDDGLF